MLLPLYKIPIQIQCRVCAIYEGKGYWLPDGPTIQWIDLSLYQFLRGTVVRYLYSTGISESLHSYSKAGIVRVSILLYCTILKWRKNEKIAQIN